MSCVRNGLLLIALCLGFSQALMSSAFLLATDYRLLTTSPDNPPALQLTSDRDFKQHLSWSPDGKKLLYTCIHQGKMGVWTCDADGKNAAGLLKEPLPHFDGSWTPDSKQIVYVHDILQGTDGKLQINTVALAGGAPSVLVPNKRSRNRPAGRPMASGWHSSARGMAIRKSTF